jgi:hypothetical protein
MVKSGFVVMAILASSIGLAHAGGGAGAGGAGVGAGSAVGAIFHGSYDWYWNRGEQWAWGEGPYGYPDACYRWHLVQTPLGLRRRQVYACR